jgi:DNA-directed RNA polymerase subunit RPC12/RpoP
MWDRGPDLDGKFVGLPHKCNDKLLRLRLKRVGGTLHYQWAPGVEGDNFQELTAQPQFGAGDVTAVRMSVLTGRKPCNVDVRLIELWVGSGGVRDAQDANAAPVPPPPNNLGPGPAVEITPSRSWMMALVIIGAVLLLFSALGAVGLVVLMKRRKPLAESAAVKAEPLVTFQCASCGKSLKAKSTASGKKLKCAQCGKAVLVP